VAEADAMIEAAHRANRLLAVNFQQRYRPEIQAAYRLIHDGQLGAIQHVEMMCLWPRTLTYYSGGGWRATWVGEGGGVLMNQAPHNLDLLCHLMGMPTRVFAWTRTLLHKIAVEDTVQAMLEWENGAIGAFHASTAETGLPERLEIVGTKGYLQIGKGQLTFNELEIDLREHILTSKERFVGPKANPVNVEIGAGAGNHVAVYQHLQDSIRNGTPLLIDGTAGRMSLELANAMIYSGHGGQPVTFPIDREQYAQLLTALQTHSNMSPLSER
jgi:predicted dehydrogenase